MLDIGIIAGVVVAALLLTYGIRALYRWDRDHNHWR